MEVDEAISGFDKAKLNEELEMGKTANSKMRTINTQIVDIDSKISQTQNAVDTYTGQMLQNAVDT